MTSAVVEGCSKVVAVHLNYRSRADERGKSPQWPSYFFKPPSTLSSSGVPVVRPCGCELLTFEGEIALVIGQRVRRSDPERAWEHVRWLTAANDFGVYDFRYADGGSNVRSKGVDGFTPLGPSMLDARSVDPQDLRLRTWVNGDVVQDALTGEEMLFSFGQIVADLSRLMTLEPMDVILTGTPTGSTIVEPGDVIEVEVTVESDGRSTGRLVSPVVQAQEPLACIGAMPRVDAEQRAAASGLGRAVVTAGDQANRVDVRSTAADTGQVSRMSTSRRERGALGRSPSPAGRLSEPLAAALRDLATATLASQLRRRGLDGLVMDDLESTRPDLHMVGSAWTIRYLPRREDLASDLQTGLNAQKRGIEEVEPGEVLVIDAGGRTDAGTIGDILALRAQVRGAAGIITDGAVRDRTNLQALDIPVYHHGTHPAVLGRRHMPFETGVMIRCAGVTVQPGDVVVGDGDGVVVLPHHLVAEMIVDAREQERQERFIAEMVAAGQPIDGLYPIASRWRPRYDEWLSGRAGGEGEGQ